MTDQELYNKVRDHLLAQKERSLRSKRCAYRGANGLKCAIGCLIPDEKYAEELEGNGASHLAVRAAAGLRREQSSLACRLQTVHDQYRPCEWRWQLAEVAQDFELQP